jgi:DNA-binding LacI/PurR family transcriptional regulator
MSDDKVTSHDVARRAGVSRTTVSIVLNQSTNVVLSAETRERVLRAASDLGYRPNSAARMLVKGNTETIGLVISRPEILPHDGFIPQLLLGISRVNQQHGFRVLVEGLDIDDAPRTYQSLVEERRIDGLIVLNPRTDDPDLRSLVDRDFPLVLIGSIRHQQEYSVNFSTQSGMDKAAGHLIALGHRRIGAVTFSPQGLVATDIRLSSLSKALAGHNILLNTQDVEYGNFSAESGYDAARKLLVKRPDLTAIVAGNDTIAIGVMSAAREQGRVIPRDLSVIGFDDLPFSAYLNPPLTTIRVDAVAQGAAAAGLLIRKLKGEEIEKRRLQVETTFIERGSCAIL